MVGFQADVFLGEVCYEAVRGRDDVFDGNSLVGKIEQAGPSASCLW